MLTRVIAFCRSVILSYTSIRACHWLQWQTLANKSSNRKWINLWYFHRIHMFSVEFNLCSNNFYGFSSLNFSNFSLYFGPKIWVSQSHAILTIRFSGKMVTHTHIRTSTGCHVHTKVQNEKSPAIAARGWSININCMCIYKYKFWQFKNNFNWIE